MSIVRSTWQWRCAEQIEFGAVLLALGLLAVLVGAPEGIGSQGGECRQEQGSFEVLVAAAGAELAAGRGAGSAGNRGEPGVGGEVAGGAECAADAETDIWAEFLRGLRERGLKVATTTDRCGVALAISDAHAGLKAAVKRSCPAPDGSAARPISPITSPRHVTDSLRAGFPTIAAMLETAARPDRVRGDVSAAKSNAAPASSKSPAATA